MTLPLAPQPSAAVTPTRSSTSTDVALIATFAALIAVCSLIAAPVGPAGVPITLQTFAVLLVGLILGPRRAFLAVSLYLVVGIVGIPVFAGGRGGVGVLVGPTVGYLLSFPLAAAVAGTWAQVAIGRSWRPRALHYSIAVVLATLTTYAAGIPAMAWRTSLTLREAFVVNLTYIPFDIVKAAVAVVVALAVARAFPALLRPRD